ncbi:MAG TPA: inorganic phosphate transporter [Thermodesulfobacteriota bacterium]|nr:inorganic phosphate transporter [Thermodesulfobacteriota bacterium]
MWLAVLVISLALLFAFSNGFHDAANVVSTMIMTRAVSPRRALLIAAACELIAPLFLGGAVAKTIGEDIIRFPAYDPAWIPTSAAFLVAALVGAVLWNLITWFFGFPSSSSHALIGGMIGAGLIAFGPDKIVWRGFLYVAVSLVISPLLGLIFGALFLRMTLYLFRNATPRANAFFNKMQIPSSIALAISHGSNDVQKSIGLIAMAFILLGFSSGFQAPLWVIAGCGAATALGTASGGWKIIKTMGSKIYRLRSVHAFCAQTSSAVVIFGAALVGGPVSTTHVVSSSIMGVGAGQRISAVRWGVAKNIIRAWVITIPASAVMAGLSFYFIQKIFSYVQ